MKFLDHFHDRTEQGQITIGAQQGSEFAKNIAGDFNPIHDAESKRFCVPGDLLFALALKEYGLHQSMAFRFLDLVAADTPLNYPAWVAGDNELQVLNSKDKAVLGVQYDGESSDDEHGIEQLLKNYVAFSGQNFPHILVPLMQRHHVMINPKRPLVIYQSMAFTLDELSFDGLEITLRKTELNTKGKRADANLYFSISSSTGEIGSGIKTLVLSGLREYDEQAVEHLTEAYFLNKKAWG